MMNKSVSLFLAISLTVLVACQDSAAKKITNANPVNNSQAATPAAQTDGPVMTDQRKQERGARNQPPRLNS